MCNPTIKARHGAALLDGRPVLQPASNRVLTPDAGRPLKKSPPLYAPISPVAAASTPLSALPSLPANENAAHGDAGGAVTPRPKAAAEAVKKRDGDNSDGLGSRGKEPLPPKPVVRSTPAERKKPKKRGLSCPSPFARLEKEKAVVPGSIAAAQREKTTLLQAQRKMRIAHYGRVPGKVVPVRSSPTASALLPADQSHEENNRSCLITANSDPMYVAYHDEEWGVPVHDDRMLFELLVLAGAQVGLDWTTILKKRAEFRTAFAGFEAEVVASFNEKKMASVSSEHGMDLGRVRSIVNNAKRILEVRKEMGSLEQYIWAFVNHRPIFTQYSSGRKMPAKTSKSEAISKDMVRRGFRLVGPTVVHSFMQAAGLTVDHLLSCPRRRHLLLQHCAATGSGSNLLEVTSAATI